MKLRTASYISKLMSQMATQNLINKYKKFVEQNKKPLMDTQDVQAELQNILHYDMVQVQSLHLKK